MQLSSGRDLTANRERAVALVARAAGAGAGLVVLPEATQCGFGGPDDDLAAAAEPLDGPFVEALTRAARAGGTTVLAGMFEAVPGEARVHNTVVAVGPDGLLDAYRKLHLYDALGWAESDRVVPGPLGADGGGLVVVPVDDVVVGVMTCYDLRFPEMARALVDRGATLLAVPAAWVAGPGKDDQWATLLSARAIESTAYVAAAAQPAPEYTGLSRLVGPDGTVRASLGATDDGCLVAGEVRAGEVAEVRGALPVLANRRFTVRPA